MNGPHVDELQYRMHLAEGVSFAGAPPLVHRTSQFEVHLNDCDLRVKMLEHFADVAAARAAVDPLLLDWEMQAALRYRGRQFSFEYITSTVVGLPPGTLAGVMRGKATLSGTLTVTHGAYPDPPTSFRASPLVQALFRVYEAAKNETRMTAAAGYFALSAVKTRVRDPSWPRGGKDRSDRGADSLKLEAAVLDTLHELTTDGGNIFTGRKVSDKAEIDNPRPPHTDRQVAWICDAIRLLALRLGEWEANPNVLVPLGMGNLPSL